MTTTSAISAPRLSASAICSEADPERRACHVLWHVPWHVPCDCLVAPRRGVPTGKPRDCTMTDTAALFTVKTPPGLFAVQAPSVSTPMGPGGDTGAISGGL